MSQFGDGTFKQAILDEVTSAAERLGRSKIETVNALAQVLAYFTEEAEIEADQLRADAKVASSE